jgi:hydrogenase small subunit
MRTEYLSNPTPLDGPGGLVQDIADLLVGDAVGAVTGSPSPGTWATFPNGYISLDYQSEVMASAGAMITDHIECLENDAPFVLALSGAIPLMDPHTLTPNGYQPFSVAGTWDTDDGNGKKERSIAEVVEWLATSANCLAVVGFGTCASYGGIPAAYGNKCASTGLYNFLVNYAGHSELAAKIVNCPGCAPHPDWMIFPVAYFILTGTLPPLNTGLVKNRVWYGHQQVFTNDVPANTPSAMYTQGGSLCTTCEKYHPTNLCTDLGAGIGDGDGTHQKELCTRQQGCNGVHGTTDCPTRRWNNFDDHTPNSWCVGANYVCQGCAEPDFPDGRSPFFEADKYDFS